VSEGDVFEMPDGADYVTAGLAEPVEPPKPAPKPAPVQVIDEDGEIGDDNAGAAKPPASFDAMLDDLL
jgi:hypothetical protein